jgi:hypothetical protein
MGAMGYESLIRTVYHCVKGGTKGANANIYRNMETTERFLTDVNWKKTDAEKILNHKTAFTEVRMYVRNALRDGLEKIKYKATRQDIEAIELMQEKLYQNRFYNKAALDVIIHDAETIFFKNGLEEG